MRLSITFICFFFIHLAFAQVNTHYETIKVWNFLKYYHPDLASGKVNADSLFLEHIGRSYKTLNESIAGLTKSLNQDFEGKQLSKKEKGDLLKNNQNFSWYQKNSNVSRANRKLLDHIYTNRFRGESHFYVPKEGYISETPNERPYTFSKEENLPPSFRLLALAKIIGAIDYLFPHKYLMAKNSEDVLKQLVNEASRAETRQAFEKILARAVATLEDTHAFRFYNQLNFRREIFHSAQFAPFDFHVKDDYLLVTRLILPEQCKKANIAVGDRITEINGKKIKAIIQDKSQLLSTSNHVTLLHRLSDYQNNIIWPDSKVIKRLTLNKKGVNQPVESTVSFVKSSDTSNMERILEYLKTKIEAKKQKKLTHSDIAYFRIDQTFKFIETTDDDKVDVEMEKLLTESASKKAIVFDMRGYPDWGGFVYTYIYGYFSEKNNYFGKYYQQALNNIGIFKYNENSETYFPKDKLYTTHPYHGKVFIIVNPDTLSASEWNTMNLQHIFPHAKTLGQMTAGADGDIKKLVLPGNYTLEFTGNGIFYPDGTQTQKKGVKLDEIIEYNDNDLLTEDDKIFSVISASL